MKISVVRDIYDGRDVAYFFDFEEAKKYRDNEGKYQYYVESVEVKEKYEPIVIENDIKGE